MLQSFRRASSSWIILGLLGLIMIAFLVTGFGTGGRGLGDLGNGPDRLATVGGQVITEQDLTRQLNRELKTAQQQRTDLDMQHFIQMGAFEDSLDQEIFDKVQLAFAHKEGIAASKRMIDGEIATNPAFQNAAGEFDETGFRADLARNGVTEGELRERILRGMVGRQMLLPIAQGTRFPSSLARFYATLLLETRSGLLTAVANKAVGPGSEPTEPEIATFFKAHHAKYTIPERRALRYASFGWADVVGTVAASDAEIEAAYRQAGAKYGPKETRAVAQLTLPDQATANSFAAKVRGGKSFAQAASEAGFAAGDIVQAEGTKDEVARKVVPELAQAAFAAKQGETIGPVRSALGWHVARIEKVTVSPGKPLTAVRTELAAAIQQRKAAEALDALVTKLDDQISNGATFDEVVSANKLQAVDTQPVTAAGTSPGTNYQLPVEAKALLKSGFELGIDDEPQVEAITPGQRYALIAVRQVVDPTVPPLAQVHDQVKADIITERSAQNAKKLTDQLVAKINAGTPIRDAVASAGVTLPPLQPVTMRRAEANRAGDRLPPPIGLLFRLLKGKAGAVPTPDGQGWFIVQAETVTPGDPKDVPLVAEQLKQPLSDSLRDEYVEQTIRAMQRELGVKRNEAAISRLKRRLLSGEQ